jgi:hypothetical protein
MSIAETLGQLALFADLTPSQLAAIAHTHEEDVFAPGERVLRRGLSGGNFYVILQGEAAVEVEGEERHVLGRGEFFGEISALTGEPPAADVVARTVLRCLVIPAAQLERLLLERPQFMLRLLRMEARRLRARSSGGSRAAVPAWATTTSWSSGSGPGRASDELLPAARSACGTRCSRATTVRRDVPALPDLPAAITWTKPEAPVERPRASTSGTTTTAALADEPELKGRHARPDGPGVRPPVAARDGGRPRHLRGARGASTCATAAPGSRRGRRTTGSCS